MKILFILRSKCECWEDSHLRILDISLLLQKNYFLKIMFMDIVYFEIINYKAMNTFNYTKHLKCFKFMIFPKTWFVRVLEFLDQEIFRHQYFVAENIYLKWGKFFSAKLENHFCKRRTY